MTIEVDQSIKIEQSGATVLACANGVTDAILLPQRVKRAGLAALRAQGKSRETATLLLFAAGLFLLLKPHVPTVQRIVIDVEYVGKDADLRGFLLRYLQHSGLELEAQRILCQRVGKRSPADTKARAVREGKDKRYRNITRRALMRVIA
jgi:hypothetical protein